ncbi:hypothetical protein WJX72_003608 [[Myrmecia] bisecta]|uniref:BACK domain-containing protein n=1 Tax=[Myrmecia] bisecta TaxID=41462 RepID=A0AAW1P740_9CHLO
MYIKELETEEESFLLRLLLLAQKYTVDDCVQQCSQALSRPGKLLLSTSAEICQLADQHSCQSEGFDALRKLADECILSNFKDLDAVWEDAPQLEAFLQMPLAVIKMLLNHEEMHVKCKNTVFVAISRWLQHEEGRLSDFGSLCPLLRWSQMSGSFLRVIFNEGPEGIPWLKCCPQVCTEALHFQVEHELVRKELQDADPRLVPRKGAATGIVTTSAHLKVPVSSLAPLDSFDGYIRQDLGAVQQKQFSQVAVKGCGYGWHDFFNIPITPVTPGDSSQKPVTQALMDVGYVQTGFLELEGEVKAAQNITYSFPVPDGASYDLQVILSSVTGDADLYVKPPNNRVAARRSQRGAGKDVATFTQAELNDAPGIYVITVQGFQTDSAFRLELITAKPATPLAAPDKAAIAKVVQSCCSADKSCPMMRTALLDNSPLDLCSAPGNVCDKDGHVKELGLRSENMACSFPAALGELTALTQLDMFFSGVGGRMDTDVAAVVKALPALENLFLAFNTLTGSITCDTTPPGSKLASLDVSSNRLTGSIPACLFASSALQKVMLSTNSLSSELPAIPAGSNLKYLSASNQQSGGFSGSLPNFSNAAALETVHLEYNAFDGTLPNVPPSLVQFCLTQNKLTGPIPASFGALPALSVLALDGNALTGSIPAGVMASPLLSNLDLSSNQLTGTLPTTWDCRGLIQLDLHSNALEGPLPGGVGALPNLTYVALQDNKMSGNLEAFAASLPSPVGGSTTNITYFNVGGNQLSGAVPNALATLAVFDGVPWVYNEGDTTWLAKTFNLSRNAFSGAVPVFAVQALAHDATLVVDLTGNSFACPTTLWIDNSYDGNRLLAAQCSEADGSLAQILSKIQVDPTKGHASPPPPPPTPASPPPLSPTQPAPLPSPAATTAASPPPAAPISTPAPTTAAVAVAASPKAAVVSPALPPALASISYFAASHIRSRQGRAYSPYECEMAPTPKDKNLMAAKALHGLPSPKGSPQIKAYQPPDMDVEAQRAGPGHAYPDEHAGPDDARLFQGEGSYKSFLEAGPSDASKRP